MRSTRYAAVLAALCALPFLPGCGVVDDVFDGSSSGSASGPTQAAMPDPALQAVGEAQSRAPAETREVQAAAAATLPSFGSVTQSSNSDASGMTTDTASVAFDGDRLTLTIARRDGHALVLLPVEEADAQAEFDPPVDGRSGRAYALGDIDEEEASAALAAVYTSWNDADPTNYLAGGFWMRIGVDIDELDPLNLEAAIQVEVGVFTDGPELSRTPTLPDTGTASYEGPATGLYAYAPGGAADTAELGFFTATASLTAEFAAGTVEGCIGCTGGIDVATETAQDGGEFAERTLPARIVLGRTAIDADGTFSDAGVSLAIDGRTIQRIDGAWGGRFSAIADADGDPRLAGGTAGVEWTESDDSQGAFLGTYFATKR